jgi:hypothetical protein
MFIAASLTAFQRPCGIPTHVFPCLVSAMKGKGSTINGRTQADERNEVAQLTKYTYLFVVDLTALSHEIAVSSV